MLRLTAKQAISMTLVALMCIIAMMLIKLATQGGVAESNTISSTTSVALGASTSTGTQSTASNETIGTLPGEASTVPGATNTPSTLPSAPEAPMNTSPDGTPISPEVTFNTTTAAPTAEPTSTTTRDLNEEAIRVATRFLEGYLTLSWSDTEEAWKSRFSSDVTTTFLEQAALPEIAEGVEYIARAETTTNEGIGSIGTSDAELFVQVYVTVRQPDKDDLTYTQTIAVRLSMIADRWIVVARYVP